MKTAERKSSESATPWWMWALLLVLLSAYLGHEVGRADRADAEQASATETVLQQKAE